MPCRASLLGIATGVVACSVLVRSGVVQRVPRADPPVDRRGEFVVAYERSRTTTYRLVSSFRREMRTGAVLESAREVVQRPPDRLLRQFGGIDGEIGGHVVLCLTSPEGTYSCRQGAPTVRPFAEEVSREVATLRTYFEGARPLYHATRAADGCYELRQDYPLPDPPYGSFARFCFDGATGAVTRLERHLVTATEVVEATSISSEVSAADLDVSADPKFAFRSSGSSSPPTTAAPLDVCAAGEGFNPAPCSDERVFAACTEADAAAKLAPELWRRRASVNDDRLSGHPCLAPYVRELFRHGYAPFG